MNKRTTLCATCARALRATKGYITGCGAAPEAQRYTRPVQAVIMDYCIDYCAQEAKTPQEPQKQP